MIEAFLEENKYVDYSDPGIQVVAKKLREIAEDEIELIRLTYYFVRDKISHSWDVRDPRVTVSASEVLREGVGICWSKANLLAALLRANGIQAGFSHQHLMTAEEPEKRFMIHALNTVYVSSLEKWIRLDARGNNDEVHAEFSLDKEILSDMRSYAWKTDFHDNHARPEPELMKLLEEYDNMLELMKLAMPRKLSYPGFELLWNHIRTLNLDEYRFSFDELAQILGFVITSTAPLTTNTIMRYGYQVDELSADEQYVVIRRKSRLSLEQRYWRSKAACTPARSSLITEH